VKLPADDQREQRPASHTACAPSWVVIEKCSTSPHGTFNKGFSAIRVMATDAVDRQPVGYAIDRIVSLSVTPPTAPIGIDGVADRARTGSMA
jgi:hypothetical protein